MASRNPENTANSFWLREQGMTNPLHAQVAAFFLERRNEIYAYVVTLGIPTAEAQELTSEVFLRYYTALRNGQSIANPRAWVYTVAHNLAMSRHAEAGTEQLPFDLQTIDQNTPETLALERERHTQLRHAIETLSPQQRCCLHLRADGLRYREIAEILSIDISTVGEMLQRAVKRLRKALYE